MGYSRKKIKRGDWGYTFVKTAPEFFILLLYPWKFQTKQSSTPGYSTQLCYLDPLDRNSKTKNKDQWKFHIIFSWSALKIPHAISLIPQEIPYSQPPCLDFFWNSPIASYILHLALFYFFINNYCWPNMLFHRQVGRVIGQSNI